MRAARHGRRPACRSPTSPRSHAPPSRCAWPSSRTPGTWRLAAPEPGRIASRGMESPGKLAIVLHTHMPYVEGFGTWPFGEEWLWEAIATSYLPLLDRVLGQAPITLSLTPVLCDQLEAPGAIERCLRFLREVRPASHQLDIDAFQASGDGAVVAELERSAAEYAAVADR